MNDLEKIKKAIEDEVCVTISEHTRERRVCKYRQMFYYFARKYTKYSFSEIAWIVKYDHSTVIAGIKVVNKDKANKSYLHELKSLETIILRELNTSRYDISRIKQLINILHHRISAIQMCNVGTLEDYIIGIFRKRIEKLEKFK